MIQILGNGLAGRVMARLLSAKGLNNAIVGDPPDMSQVMLLNQDVIALIEEIFEIDDLARCCTVVPGRLLYQANGSGRRVDIPAVAMTMSNLLAALPETSVSPLVDAPPQIQIDATGRAAVHAKDWSAGRLHRYGERVVLGATAPGRLARAKMSVSQDGWLFAFPLSRDEICLQAMVLKVNGDPTDCMREILSMSRILPKAFSPEDISDVVTLNAAPQMPERIVSPNGLAIGAAAFAMDPISGDGVGATLQSALLAAAVCEAPKPAHFSHFEERHRKSFARHLGHVADYYRPQLNDPRWSLELRTTYMAVDATRSYLSQEMSYTLKNGTLRAHTPQRDVNLA